MIQLSILTTNLIIKVDATDYYGFALNEALNKHCLNKILKKNTKL